MEEKPQAAQSAGIPRIVEPTDASHFMVATMRLMTLAPPYGMADSIVAIPGLGEHERVIEAIWCWDHNRNPNAKTLIIAGHNHNEATMQPPLSMERLQQSPFGLHRTKGVIVDGHRNHTGDQMAWVAEQVIKNDIRCLQMYVSSYHLLRAYMTLVQALVFKQQRWIPIVPAPVLTEMTRKSPESGCTMKELAHGEAMRILQYQKKGDVVSFEDFDWYLDWVGFVLRRNHPS